MTARYSPLLVGAVGALVVAATLVAYLQRRSAEQERERTGAILQQVCERTAMVLSARFRDLFDNAVLDTIEGIGHPQIKDYDTVRVASFFNDGVSRYPYVERFFLWSDRFPPQFRDQVAFFRPYLEAGPRQMSIAAPDGKPLGDFFSEPAMGRPILAQALALAETQRSFAVVDESVNGVPYQVTLHFLWDDAARHQVFAVIGYVVNLDRMRSHLFSTIMGGELAQILNPNPRSPELALTVRDDQGRIVYGSPSVLDVPSASSSVEMLFFPGDALNQWLVERPAAPRWKLTVSAARPVAAAAQGYWLFTALMALLLVALFCAVTVDRQARRLSQMQADFVANVSHQLKTPLSLLASASETLGLERVRSPEKVKEYAEIVRGQTARLTGLVEQILDFSKTAASVDTGERESVDLSELVKGTVDSFAKALSNRNVSIRFEPSPVHPIVEADAKALDQAVVNLLSNAVQYGREMNEVVVRVDANGSRATISVRDLGIGIDPVDLPHVFEKFYRGRNGGSSRRGFGLGLTIVQTIVGRHGGTVSVESEVGRGSEFRVVLPATTVRREAAGVGAAVAV